MVPIRIKGVLFWGIDKGSVTREEVKKVSVPVDSVLHLLHHFKVVPEAWSQRMVAEGVATRESIEDRLKMPGSKWNPKTNLETPEDVIRFSRSLLELDIQQGQRKLKWIGREKIDFCYFPHLVTPDEKKQLLGCASDVSMGIMGLVPLKELSEGVKIRRSFNRGGMVNVVKMVCPITDRVVITLAKRETGIIQIYSAFPGILTPPIPRDNQISEEQKYNSLFWEQYVLIEAVN